MVEWNLEDIYPFNETKNLINELRSKVESFKKHRSLLNEKTTSGEVIKILKEIEEIEILSNKLESYASLNFYINTTNQEINSHLSKLENLLTELGNEIIFFSLWFKNLSENTSKNIIKDSGKYFYFLKRIRDSKKYTLSEKEEQIDNIKSVTGNTALMRIYDILTNTLEFEIDGEKLNQEAIRKYFQDADRNKRKKAYETYFDKFSQNQLILGEIYKNLVTDWKNEYITLRKFSTPIGVRNHSNDIPDSVVKTMLSVVKKNTYLFQEYFKLKAKILGIKDFSRYDVLAPYTKLNKKYSYENSKQIVLEVFKGFSEDFYKNAKEVFDKKHVHSNVQKNKRGGAFAHQISKDSIPYTMLNHADKLNDMFTMAHELGHCVHYMLAKDQTEFTYHSNLPLAETASNLGEMLLANRLLNTNDTEEKKAILMKLLDNEYASISRQTFFVLFEIEAHKRIAEGATIDELNELYINNLKELFKDSLTIPDYFKYEWNQIPHIHETPFYCYAYSFGNLLTLSLFNRYKKEGKKFIPKILSILKAGGSKEPKQILEDIGIDISKEEFWQEGFEIIKEQIQELKKLVSL